MLFAKLAKALSWTDSLKVLKQKDRFTKCSKDLSVFSNGINNLELSGLVILFIACRRLGTCRTCQPVVSTREDYGVIHLERAYMARAGHPGHHAQPA